MTTAEQLLAAWEARTTTFPLQSLARRLDREVVICRPYNSAHAIYLEYWFSDGSIAFSQGKGKSHLVGLVS